MSRLTIANLATATFDCTFGRGCEGVCCRNGRPPIYPDEVARIDSVLPDLLPELRPAARHAVERAGCPALRRLLT